jgi:hypothetical protein
MPKMLGRKVFIDVNSSKSLKGTMLGFKLKDEPNKWYYGTLVDFLWRNKGRLLFKEDSLPIVFNYNLKEVRICKHQTL